MTQTLQFTRCFVVEECYSCGTHFAITKDLYDRLQREGPAGLFYCPRGHGQCYTSKPFAEQLREAQQKIRDAEAETNNQRGLRRLAEEKAEAAAKRLANAKKRARAGVCPDCHRTFQNVVSHMDKKHGVRS